jgi:hypothetical protein
MATKPGVLSRIASKTVAAGRAHISKVIKGEETLAEAAGATVGDLLSTPKAKSALKSSVRKASQKGPLLFGNGPCRKRDQLERKQKNRKLHSNIWAKRRTDYAAGKIITGALEREIDGGSRAGFWDNVCPKYQKPI